MCCRVFVIFTAAKTNGVIPGSGKPAVPPNAQKDLKSPCLQSALQGKPSDEPDGQPPAKRKKIDLIFKDVLEASLEDSSKSRSQCSLPSECKSAALGSGFNSSESSFNVPNLKVEEKEEEDENSAEPSTSFCPNCVKLKRRILELEEELSRLRGEQGGAAGPPMSQQTQLDRAPPHPEQGPIEDFHGMIRETVVGPKVQPESFISASSVAAFHYVTPSFLYFMELFDLQIVM